MDPDVKARQRCRSPVCLNSVERLARSVQWCEFPLHSPQQSSPMFPERVTHAPVFQNISSGFNNSPVPCTADNTILSLSQMKRIVKCGFVFFPEPNKMVICNWKSSPLSSVVFIPILRASVTLSFPPQAVLWCVIRRFDLSGGQGL